MCFPWAWRSFASVTKKRKINLKKMFAGCLHVSLHVRFYLAHRILREPRKENEQICFRGNQHSVSEAFLFPAPVTAHRLHRLSASINSRGDFFFFFLMMNLVSAHEHVGFSLSFVFHLLKKNKKKNMSAQAQSCRMYSLDAAHGGKTEAECVWVK